LIRGFLVFRALENKDRRETLDDSEAQGSQKGAGPDEAPIGESNTKNVRGKIIG
jgi:hypothetical protein